VTKITEKNSSSGLYTGAIVGIAVGASVGALLLGALTGFCIYKKDKHVRTKTGKETVITSKSRSNKISSNKVIDDKEEPCKIMTDEEDISEH